MICTINLKDLQSLSKVKVYQKNLRLIYNKSNKGKDQPQRACHIVSIQIELMISNSRYDFPGPAPDFF